MKRLVLIFLLATPALGAVINPDSTPSGQLGAAVTSVAVTTDQLQFPANAKNRGVIFTLRNTAGTATADVQQNCTGAGTDWGTVLNGTKSLTVSSGIVAVQYPYCQFRVSVTACSTCNVSVFYSTQPDLQ